MDVMVQLDKGAYMPERAHDTDAGADIRTPVGFLLPPHCSRTIRTGVHVQLPPDTVGMLKSKSGLNVNHNIVGEGVIDEGYDGEIRVKLYNLGRRFHRFHAGDKVIQLVVMPVAYPNYSQVKTIAGGERGDGGFGSTGR